MTAPANPEWQSAPLHLAPSELHMKSVGDYSAFKAPNVRREVAYPQQRYASSHVFDAAEDQESITLSEATPLLAPNSNRSNSFVETSLDSICLGTDPSNSRNTSGIRQFTWQNARNNIGLFGFLYNVPSTLIAISLNLMLSVPFGLSIFPRDWNSMPIPHAAGIQLFLLTTAICQFVFVFKSSFSCAVGMMMVENIPFLNALSMSIIHSMESIGRPPEAILATILVTYALSTVVVGICFYALGVLQLGNLIYMFPKHIIIGAVGGIGVFVLHSGIEHAIGSNVSLTLHGLKHLFRPEARWLWITSLLLAVFLSSLLRFGCQLCRLLKWQTGKRALTSPAFPALYFMSIPIVFYIALWFSDYSISDARAHGWLFEHEPNVSIPAILTRFDLCQVDWPIIFSQCGTLLGLTIFSLMHVPINIPSLSLTTQQEVDINKELRAHGISNVVAGFSGCVQNYLCYSTSALYYKCGGGGRYSGLAIGVAMLGLITVGSSAVAYVPRCLAGCLMLHLGLDLMKESLLDTVHVLDWMELSTVYVIALSMTVLGMNEGLAIGIILACMTFVLQSANLRSNAPVRGSMSAVTLRSNVWRRPQVLDKLDELCCCIHVVQLQGHLFFGNANKVTFYVQGLFDAACCMNDHCVRFSEDAPLTYGSSTNVRTSIRYLILDFTLVIGVDSSAADAMAKLKHVCEAQNCCLVFAAVPKGYSKFVRTLESLLATSSKSKQISRMSAAQHEVFLAEDLNAALEWCENRIIRQEALFELESDSSLEDNEAFLKRLHHLIPDRPISTLHKLLEYCYVRQVGHNEVLWRQGDNADNAMILVNGQLLSILENEVGTTEDVAVGSIVGELCMLTGEKRKTTLVAAKPSTIYVLTRSQLDIMISQDPQLALLFQQLALRYASHRLQYVGNRIWETKCIPI